MEFTHWKRRLQDHFERMGFSLLTERLAMQDMVKLEATHGAFLFFPVTIHLYERSGWKMVAFEAETGRIRNSSSSRLPRCSNS